MMRGYAEERGGRSSVVALPIPPICIGAHLWPRVRSDVRPGTPLAPAWCMAEHKTKPATDRRAESATGQEGSGRQHPTATGPAYKAPKERGAAGGKAGGKKDRHQGS
jgi:hypothetical protein